jgi:hypothetical protein
MALPFAAAPTLTGTKVRAGDLADDAAPANSFLRHHKNVLMLKPWPAQYAT